MILTRLGNKRRMANKLYGLFPQHKIRIITFFGAGGDYFGMPKPKHCIANDLDSNVFNLFQVVSNQKEQLIEAFIKMPIHNDLFKYWKKNIEVEPVKKAIRFLFLSNFSYMGKMDTLAFKSRDETKDVFIKGIERTFETIKNVKFNNCDFRKFLNDISFVDIDYGKPSGERKSTFIYNDPPYLGTTDTYYDSEKWCNKDVCDLMDINISLNCKFAISEFDNDFVIQEAKRRNLNIINIGERQNMKNRRTEILITNYNLKQELTLFSNELNKHT